MSSPSNQSSSTEEFDSIYLLLLDLDSELGAGQSTTAKPLPIVPFQHWAVRVRDYCYEVTGNGDEDDDKGVLLTRGKKVENGLNIVSTQEWEKRYGSTKSEPKTRKVGVTRRDDGYIRKEAERIWHNRTAMQDMISSQNCQNFAQILFDRIHLKPEDASKVPREERTTWKTMPRRATQFKTLAKKIGPYLAVAVGLQAAFMAFQAEANPLMNVAVCAAIAATPLVVPLLLARNADSKWEEQIKQAERVLAVSEFAENEPVTDPSIDFYQGYNKYNVDLFSHMTESDPKDIVWALRCFRVPVHDGKPFNVEGDDWDALVAALSSRPPSVQPGRAANTGGASGWLTGRATRGTQ